MQYLYDYEFLKEVDKQHVKELYVQIEALDWNENSLALIEGVCTGGSISLNAKSSMRRSGSLSMIANYKNKNIMDVNNLISINKKVSIQVGVKNEVVNPLYQDLDILWFPMGVFVIMSASINKTQNELNISISFKDKMVLLNGEVGGTFSGPVTHSPGYVEDLTSATGYKEESVKFYDLIHTLATEFGYLPEHQVIIDDVNLRTKNTLRYIGNKTFWIYPVDEEGTITSWVYTETEPAEGSFEQYKFSTGSHIGYQYTDFIYPLEKDLTSNPGESVESVLKNITKQLVNYEYFFDVHGIFRFQEIKNGLNKGSAEDDLASAIGDKFLAQSQSDKATYAFDNDELFTSLAVNPQYQNIKNAFVCWGEKKGTKTPIRYHLILDTPPKLTSSKTYLFYTKSATYLINNQPISYNRGYKTAVPGASLTSIELEPDDDWRIVLYYELLTGAQESPYAKEYIEEFPKQFDIINKQWLVEEEDLTYLLEMVDPLQIQHPSVIQLGVRNIGYRLKSENKSEIDAIKLSTKTPNVILTKEGDTQIAEAKENEQLYLIIKDEVIQTEDGGEQVINILNDTILGSTVNAAYDYVRSELHAALSYLDTIQINCIPIYYLEPGQKIHVTDYDTGINGDYIIQSMSIPLTVDGTMSISATRAIERI